MKYEIYDDKIIYVSDEGEELAFVTFPEVEEGVLDIQHTFVDDALRGQGIAAKLMQLAYTKIKMEGEKTYLTCPYAVNYFAKNVEKQDIVVPS